MGAACYAVAQKKVYNAPPKSIAGSTQKAAAHARESTNVGKKEKESRNGCFSTCLQKEYLV
jgi:hypothetical protein